LQLTGTSALQVSLVALGAVGLVAAARGSRGPATEPQKDSSKGLVAISILAGLSLIFAGIVNLVAGFMGLFPGLFEASVANAQSEGADSVGFLALLGTPYGRYAIAHLAGAGLQLAGGSWFGWLARSPLLHCVAVLCAVSLGLELWGWALKGTLSVLSVPGVVAAVLTATVYVQLLRGKAAA